MNGKKLENCSILTLIANVVQKRTCALNSSTHTHTFAIVKVVMANCDGIEQNWNRIHTFIYCACIWWILNLSFACLGWWYFVLSFALFAVHSIFHNFHRWQNMDDMQTAIDRRHQPYFCAETGATHTHTHNNFHCSLTHHLECCVESHYPHFASLLFTSALYRNISSLSSSY